MPEFELQSDLKHQQHQPQAREDLQRFRRRAMKQIVERLRRQCAEQRRTEQQTDQDFTHRRGLTNPPRRPAAHAPGQHDDRQFQQREIEQQLVRLYRQYMPPLIETT